MNLYTIKNIYKIKSYKIKINTNFHNNKIPKEGSQCICMSVILINSVFRIDYSLVHLEECKHVVKEKKMSNYINDDINIFSGDFDTEDSDYSDEQNSI